MTGFCVLSDRYQEEDTCFALRAACYLKSKFNFRPKNIVQTASYVCEVESWCPIEVDRLPLGEKRALMERAEDYTVFIKNSVAFPYFGQEYARNNLIGKNGKPCMYKKLEDGSTNGCQIFRLGDMVSLANGNFSQ